MAQPYHQIFENNRKWIADKLAGNPHFFEHHSVTQLPEYLFIGCSDSRADPEEMMGLDIGEVFVHRNVANIVNPIDLNATTVIQYAVENLNVKHIIVCGHYGCGGIKAALQTNGLGKRSPWLQIIKDIYRIHHDELETISDDRRRYDRLVELNVIEQSLNVIKMDCVQTRYEKQDFPLVHGWVYDMRTGKIIDLKIDFRRELKRYKDER